MSREQMKREQYKRREYRLRILWKYSMFLCISSLIALLVFDREAMHSLPEQQETSSYLEESNDKTRAKENNDKEEPEVIFAVEEPIEDSSETQADLGYLHSPYMILVDLESGEVLSERNARDRIYPASLTKIMTAVLAIENTENMDEVITLSPDIFQNLYEENASVAGFEPEEAVRLRDLLYGILLPSGAECCLAFADKVAGSEEDFVELMNRKAESLGMENTHFCNATGLQNPDHYSTAKDISVLLQYALKNESFKEAFTCRSYTTTSSRQHPDGITFYSTMFEKMDDAEVTGGEILGGKTGYTTQAGLCLASLARLGGKEYILVTAKAEGDQQTEPFHILDAKNAYTRIYMRMLLRSMMPHFCANGMEEGDLER